MANILLITSSPRGSESYSNRIADTVIRDLRNNDPDALLMVRDLAQDPLPHVDDDFVAATRGREGPQTTRQQAILAES
ncbi:MAG TPA: NAD(P)H-dependent oxidoreductase, partial [Xanthobacteraceae bacterium]